MPVSESEARGLLSRAVDQGQLAVNLACGGSVDIPNEVARILVIAGQTLLEEMGRRGLTVEQEKFRELLLSLRS